MSGRCMTQSNKKHKHETTAIKSNVKLKTKKQTTAERKALTIKTAEDDIQARRGTTRRETLAQFHL